MIKDNNLDLFLRRPEKTYQYRLLVDAYCKLINKIHKSLSFKREQSILYKHNHLSILTHTWPAAQFEGYSDLYSIGFGKKTYLGFAKTERLIFLDIFSEEQVKPPCVTSSYRSHFFIPIRSLIQDESLPIEIRRFFLFNLDIEEV